MLLIFFQLKLITISSHSNQEDEEIKNPENHVQKNKRSEHKQQADRKTV
jgi:hypothetical protein